MNLTLDKQTRLAVFTALALAATIAPPVLALEPPADKNYAGMNTWFASSWDGARPFADLMHNCATFVNPAGADFTMIYSTSTDTSVTPNVRLGVNGTYNIQFTGQATIACAYAAAP